MSRVKAISNEHISYGINENDHNPPHVHVDGGGASVRINLRTLEVMDKKTDFSEQTLRKILAVVKDKQDFLIQEWEERHGKKS